MADENQTILIQIKVSEEEVKEKILAARQAMALLKKESSALDKEYKEGIITTKEYAQSQQAIKTQMASASSEIKKGEKTLSDYAKTQKAAEGSILQMRAQLPLLTQQYVALSKAEREAGEGQALQKHIHDLSEELKSNESAIGSNQRNVGNYVKSLNVMGINVGQAADQFKNGFEGAQIFAKGIMTSRGALVALTTVPIIALLVGLIAFLKSTDEGADKLEQTVNFLTEAFDSLLKGVAPLGKLLVDLFTSPLETAKKLLAGTNEYSVSLDKVVANAIRAGAAQAAYTKTMQDVEDAEDALIAQRARVGLQVDQALLKVKDRSLSEKQRIEILNQAGKAEAGLSAATLRNAQTALTALIKLNKERSRSRELSDSEKKAQQEAQAAVFNAQRESLGVQQTIQNRRSALIEQDAADSKAAAEKAKQARKDAAAELVAEAERALIMAKRKGQETLSIEVELINRRRNAELVDAKGRQARLLIQAKAEAEILKLRTDAAIQADEVLFATQEAKLGARLALAQKGSQEELKIQKDLLTVQLDQQKSAAVDAAKLLPQTLDNKKALTAKLRLLDAKYNSDTEQLNEAFEKSQINAGNDLATKRLQTEVDLGKLSLSERQQSDRNRIDQEEKTQLKLLEVEKKYRLAQLALDDADGRLKVEQEFLVRQNAIQAKTLAAHKELNKQILLNAIEEHEQELADRLEKVKTGTKAELQIKKAQLDDEKQKAIANAKGTQEEIQKETTKIEDRYKTKKQKLDKEYAENLANNILNSLSQASSVLSKIIDGQTSAQLNALEDRQNAELSSAALSADARAKIESDFQKKKNEIEKQAAEKRRKIAHVENIIAIARGITESFKLPPPFNFINAALVTATGLAEMVVIDNQKFAKGGYLEGPSHTQGGVKYRLGNRQIELEGGEAIINKKSTAKHYPLLSAINSDQGYGRPFPGVRPSIGRTFDISHATPKFQYGGINTSIDTEAIADAVERGIARANISVGVDEISRKQASVKRAEIRGDS